MTTDKVGITARSLIRRINRALAPHEELHSAGRSERVAEQMGMYFVVDRKEKRVTQRKVDLAALGRKLGVMNEWEILI